MRAGSTCRSSSSSTPAERAPTSSSSAAPSCAPARGTSGTGKRFFGDGATPAGLKLVDSKASKTGVTINVYERAGGVDPGSFEFDEPTAAEVERRRRLAGD